jgi:hypothetical protein
MKKLPLLALAMLIYSISYAQNTRPDCKAFRTGNYLYTDTSTNTWELKRTKNHQTERNKRNGQVIKFKIQWLSDCEYQLTQTWTNIRSRRKWNRASFTYRIVSSTDNSYAYSCACKDSPSISGTVVRTLN